MVNVVGSSSMCKVVVSTPKLIMKAGSTAEKQTQVSSPRPATDKEMLDMDNNAKLCDD